VTISASPELNQEDPNDQVILHTTALWDHDNDPNTPEIKQEIYTSIKSKALHFKNLCFEQTILQRLQPDGNDVYFWYENTYHTDAEGRFGTSPRGYGQINSNQKRIAVYYDGCRFYDRKQGAGGGIISRNSNYTKIADTDVFSGTALLLDNTVSDIRLSPGSGAHIDVWQLTGSATDYTMMRNKICFGLRAWDCEHNQPILLDKTRSEFSRIAMVDVSNEGNPPGDTEGINIMSIADHIFMSNCSFDHFLGFYGVGGLSTPSSDSYTNSSVQNTLFKSWNSEAGQTTVPTGVWVRNCLGKASGNNLVGAGSNGTGLWNNILKNNFTLEWDGTDLRPEGPGWDQAEALGGVPLPGFNDDPPIGHFQYDEQRTLPAIEVDEISTSDGASILPGDTIILQATIADFDTVTGSIVVGGSDTGVTGVLDGDVYRIEFTTDSTLESTTTWSSNITLTNSEGIVDESRNGLVFVESPDGPRSGPFPSNVGVNGGIVETWEPWSVGRTEMIVAKDTGTDIDFGGRGFYMDVNDRESINGMDGITLENFHVVGGPKLEWSGPDSNGIYEADIPGDGTEIPRVGSVSGYSSISSLSIPRLQKNIPFQACWPTNNNYEEWPWDIALNFDFFITVHTSYGEPPQPDRIGDVLVSTDDGTNETYNLNWDSLPESRQDTDGLFRGIKIRKDLGGNDTHLELNAIFQDVEHISPDDPERTKLHIIINADANVTNDFIIDSWDPDHIGPNGEEGGLLRVTADGSDDDLGNRTWKYRGYAHFVITGKKEFIANRPNRYSISWENGKIYYKPANNDWLDNEGNPEGFFPVGSRAFDQGRNYTLKRATFSGFATKSSASSVVDGNNATNTITRLENCLFIGNGTNCREGSWNLYECMMWYPDARGMAGIKGPSQIRKTNFHGFPRSSAMFTSGPVGDVDSIPNEILPVEVKEILIDGCYFDVTFSNHGQGCSLYTNSWNNVIVTNNIFHNCQRALSFQPGSEPRNPYTAKTIFANNLFLYDRYFGPGLGGGQPTFSFNGGRDTQMPRAEGIDDTAPYVAGEPGSEYDNDTVLTQDPQQVRLWNNTILIDESSFTQEELEKSDVGGWGSIQLEKLISSDVVISNNLIVGSGAPLREDNTGSTGHIFRNNAKVDVDKTGFKYTSGKYDYLNTQFEARVIQTDPIDGFDHENNIIRSTSRLNTSANDGGKLGVRWDSYPTDDVMYNIPVGWYDTYVGSSSNAYEEIGGRTRADFVNDPFVTEDAYAMGDEDRRAYGLPVLVERFTVRRKDDDAGNQPADYTLRDEDIFTPHPSFLGRLPGNVVSHIFLNHGDQVQSEAGGQATNSFDTQENRENFYKKYEIRFRWTDGTVENGSVKNPIPLQPYPAQHTIINGYNSSNSRMLKYDGGPGSDKAPMMGVEEGIWKWEPGCEVEFFIYKLEPFESNQNQDGDTNPREWPEFDETDTTEFPVQGGVVPGDRLYARPVAFFETPAINEYTESVTARVIVHPYNGVKDNGTPNGINRVDFYLNDGTPISVSTPVTYTTDAGFEEVAYEVTYRGSLSQELNEIRAVVWPNVGRVRILQGTGYFSSDGIDIYGVRVDDNSFNPLDWGPGYNTQERGCLLQVTSDTYYISPDGSDVDGNGSLEDPYQTPFKVYEEHGTNCVIDNSAYSDNSIALNVADFHVVRNVLDYGYVDRDAFDGRIPLPIIKGGTVIGVPNTEQGLVRPPRLVGENDFPSGEAGQFLEFVPGFIFKNCDIRTPDADEPEEFIECIHYSFQGGQGTRRTNTARMIFDNCDFGPSDNAIPELLQQRPFGSSTTGIMFEWKQVGQNSPVYLYNCVTRYTHFKNLRENFHCKSVGIGMVDPYNSDKLFDTHIKNVNPFLWPWGPIGETEICNKGEFDDHNPQTNGGGDNGATIQNVLDAVQNLYTELGDPESSKPEFDDDGNLIPGTGPLPNSTYINVVDSVNSDGTPGNVIDPSNWSEVDRIIPYEKNWFLKSESEVDPVAWSELRAIWNVIPTANNQMFPAVVLDIQRAGDFPFKRRTTPGEGQSNGASGINIGTIDSIFDNLGRRNGSSDPHVDIQQSFWMSQYRTDLSEPVVDKTWLSNTVAASIRIDGNANGFQGIFHADSSAVLESGFWNLNWESDPETTQANFITLTAGHAGQEYGHTGTHVGPNITRRNPDVAFRMRTDAFNSGVGNITFYENRDTRQPLSGNGTVAFLAGWPSYPESNPVEMIQNSGISHWYHINVPYTLTVLSSVTFETIPGTNNSTVTEAFNSDRIGTFQPYTQKYTWTVGEEYIENFTSGQLRFGPAVTWNPGNGADTYGAITLTNRSTAPTEWVETFKRNEHILRVSITIDGNENVYMFDKFNDPFNPQTGYIIIPSNRFDEWDHTRNMTIKMELLST